MHGPAPTIGVGPSASDCARKSVSGSDLVVAELAQRAVRHHAVAAWRFHALQDLFHPGLAFRLFPAGRVGDPEAVQVNVERIDVVRVGTALEDETEKCAQGLLGTRRTPIAVAAKCGNGSTTSHPKCVAIMPALNATDPLFHRSCPMWTYRAMSGRDHHYWGRRGLVSKWLLLSCFRHGS